MMRARVPGLLFEVMIVRPTHHTNSITQIRGKGYEAHYAQRSFDRLSYQRNGPRFAGLCYECLRDHQQHKTRNANNNEMVIHMPGVSLLTRMVCFAPSD